MHNPTDHFTSFQPMRLQEIDEIRHPLWIYYSYDINPYINIFLALIFLWIYAICISKDKITAKMSRFMVDFNLFTYFIILPINLYINSRGCDWLGRWWDQGIIGLWLASPWWHCQLLTPSPVPTLITMFIFTSHVLYNTRQEYGEQYDSYQTTTRSPDNNTQLGIIWK